MVKEGELPDAESWISVKPKNESTELEIDGSPNEHRTDESDGVADNDEMDGSKEVEQNLIGNHVKEIRKSSNSANSVEDNDRHSKESNVVTYSEFPGETLVETEDMTDQTDKTTNGVVHEMDKQVGNKTHKEDKEENAIKIDDNAKAEFLLSSPMSLTCSNESDRTSDQHQDSGKEIRSISKETVIGTSNEEQIKIVTDENVESTDSLLESVESCSEKSEDMEDGFMKFLKMCAGGRAKRLDQDDEMYGFDDDSERASSKRSRRKRPSFHRSRGICVSPTPFSVHYKEVTNQKFDFRTSPKQGTTKTGIEKEKPKEISAQQETGLCSEIVDDDQYNFSYPQRGHMVLIVNDRFLRQSPRDGANWDLQKTKQIASKLGFRIFNSNHCRNLTKKETISILRQAQNLDHSDSDCFMFVISTHGLEMANPRAKGKLDHVIVCSDDQLIFTSNILEMFSEKNCPTLKNKPKIFFIQACRGDNYDTGSSVPVLKTRGNEDRTDIAACTNRDRFGRVKPPSVDVTDTRPSGDSWAAGSHRSTATAQLSPPTRSHTGDACGFFPMSGERRFETGDQNLDYSQTYVARARSSSGQQSAGADDQRFFQTSQLLREHSVNDITLQRPYPVNDSPSLQCDNDYLVMYAIPPGYFAWRNTADGSWMIDYLFKTVMAYDMKKPQDFLKLLRKVSRRMSTRQTNTPSDPRMHEMKAVSVIEHKLVKDIVFKPKAVQSTWVREDITFLI